MKKIMLKNKTYLIFGLCFVFIAAAISLIFNELWHLTHSAENGGDKTDLTVYSCFENYSLKSTALTNIVDKYNEESPDTDVNIDTVSPNAFYLKLAADFSANCASDIVIAPPSYDTRMLYERGYLACLNDMFEENTDLKENTDKSFLKFTTEEKDGKSEIYGIPFDAEYIVLYCNKDIFTRCNANIPKTFGEFKESVAKIRAEGITPVACGAQDSEFYFYQALYAMESSYQSEDTAFNKYAHEMAIEKYKEFYDMGAFPASYEDTSREEYRELFLNGEAAMIVETNSFADDIVQYASGIKAGRDEFFEKFEISSFPTNAYKTSDDRYYPTVAYNAGKFTVFVNKKSYEAKKDAIKDFINYLSSSETLRLYQAHANDIMTMKNAETNANEASLISKCKVAIFYATEYKQMPSATMYRETWNRGLLKKMPDVLQGRCTAKELIYGIEEISEKLTYEKDVRAVEE